MTSKSGPNTPTLPDPVISVTKKLLQTPPVSSSLKEAMTISISPACRMGYYKPANDSAGCRLCPANTRTHGEGSERCDCLQGFSRLPTDSDDLSCTSKTLSGFTGNQQVSSYYKTSLLEQTLKPICEFENGQLWLPPLVESKNTLQQTEMNNTCPSSLV